mmetsp:Transcript_12166/g.25783  ORF Transcript_12166/g.25783 Transcript_12166/m.25783 type:complete len:682 (+) Transcript_12166:335-2380(+)
MIFDSGVIRALSLVVLGLNLGAVTASGSAYEDDLKPDYWVAPQPTLGLECIGKSIASSGQTVCISEGEAICYGEQTNAAGIGQVAMGVRNKRAMVFDNNNHPVWIFCTRVSHICIGEYRDFDPYKYSKVRPYMFFYDDKSNLEVGRLTCDGTDGKDDENVDKNTILKIVDQNELDGPYAPYPLTTVKFKKGQTEDPEDDNYLWKIVYDPSMPEPDAWNLPPTDATYVVNEDKCEWTDLCPSNAPSTTPSAAPSSSPSDPPSVSFEPSGSPSGSPSMAPSTSMEPSPLASDSPSGAPTVSMMPTSSPSDTPSSSPTGCDIEVSEYDCFAKPEFTEDSLRVPCEEALTCNTYQRPKQLTFEYAYVEGCPENDGLRGYDCGFVSQTKGGGVLMVKGNYFGQIGAMLSRGRFKDNDFLELLWFFEEAGVEYLVSDVDEEGNPVPKPKPIWVGDEFELSFESFPGVVTYIAFDTSYNIALYSTFDVRCFPGSDFNEYELGSSFGNAVLRKYEDTNENAITSHFFLNYEYTITNKCTDRGKLAMLTRKFCTASCEDGNKFSCPYIDTWNPFACVSDEVMTENGCSAVPSNLSVPGRGAGNGGIITITDDLVGIPSVDLTETNIKIGLDATVKYVDTWQMATTWSENVDGACPEEVIAPDNSGNNKDDNKKKENKNKQKEKGGWLRGL